MACSVSRCGKQRRSSCPSCGRIWGKPSWSAPPHVAPGQKTHRVKWFEGQALDILRQLEPDREPRREVDLMDSEFRCPADGSEPLVEAPLRISEESTVKDAYLLMKMRDSQVIYVHERGILMLGPRGIKLLNQLVGRGCSSGSVTAVGQVGAYPNRLWTSQEGLVDAGDLALQGSLTLKKRDLTR